MQQNECILNTPPKFLQHPGVIRNFPTFKKKMHDMIDRNCYTPDMMQIEAQRGHLLFVYGTLKNGCTRNWMLKSYKARFVASAISWNMFSMFYSPKLGFPVVMPSYKESAVGNIVGQLWIVPPKAIRVLDECEKNGDMYFRQRINTQIITKPTDTNFQQYACQYAWAYIGNPLEWIAPIHDGRMLALVPQDNNMINYIQPNNY
jgi:gamma-glutamylcyclotransferase (GGCT)/AIG2-like uncharacterized protein YtfP